MPPRRCSGLSTRNRPPNASRARPPSSCGWQRSSSRTLRPRSSSSSAVTRPAIPAPTTTTSCVRALPSWTATRASYARAPRRCGTARRRFLRHSYAFLALLPGAGRAIRTVLPSLIGRRLARRLGPAVVAAAAFAVAVFPPTAHAPAASAAAPRGQVTVLRLKLPWAPSVTRDVWVYRPAVADSKTLPVLYFLHGVPGSAVDPFRAGLATSLDNYFAAGNQPFVVAAPDGNGVKHADSEWADSAD